MCSKEEDTRRTQIIGQQKKRKKKKARKKHLSFIKTKVTLNWTKPKGFFILKDPIFYELSRKNLISLQGNSFDILNLYFRTKEYWKLWTEEDIGKQTVLETLKEQYYSESGLVSASEYKYAAI